MRAAEWIATVPWCITEAALEAMIGIAERQPLPDTDERMHGPTSLALRAGAKRDDSARMQMRGEVAVIRIDGPIFRYADFFTETSGGITTEALARDLQAALDDPRVAAICFVIDSPGGEATGIGELADAIYAARGKKPMGSYIEGYGASAAYWIASAAGQVVVDPSALTGSIGTVMSAPNPEARPKPARSIEVVSTQSPKKRVNVATQAGQAYLQGLVDDMTEVFIAAVQRNRGLTREQVLAVEGGLLVGQQAVDAGLADATGSEEGTIAALQGQAAARRRPAHLSQPRRVAAEETATMPGLRDFWASFWGGAQDAGMFAPVAGDDISPPVAASLLTARPLAAGEQLQEGEAPAGLAAEPIATPTAAADLGEIERLRTELARRDQAAAQQADEQRRAAATTFADRLVAEQRALPAERDAIAAAHLEAARAGPAVLAAVEGAYTARPAHSLTQELVSVATSGALPPATTGEVSEQRRRELLALTPLGRAALKAKSA